MGAKSSNLRAPYVPGGYEIEFLLASRNGASLVAAGRHFSVLLSTDGEALVLGPVGNRHLRSPTLPAGCIFESVAAGAGHAILVRSDGQALAWGDEEEGQCEIPQLMSSSSSSGACGSAGGYNTVSGTENITYLAAAASTAHSVLLRSDGRVCTCGLPGHGRCDVPELPAGVRYVAVAAGEMHTVLLRSDGNAIAYGCNKQGQCLVPRLPAGCFYVKVAAGLYHTVLIRSDGQAMAFGSNFLGKCEVPPLSPGLFYVGAAAGGSHTVLLRSDGQAVAFGENEYGQCDVPRLSSGQRYVAAATGHFHTLLLRNDGLALAFGRGNEGQTALPDQAQCQRFRYPDSEPQVLITVHVPPDEASDMTKCVLHQGSGGEVRSVNFHKSDALIIGELRCMLSQRLRKPVWKVDLARPDGSLIIPTHDVLTVTQALSTISRGI